MVLIGQPGEKRPLEIHRNSGWEDIIKMDLKKNIREHGLV
jgi:hypothetical protein